MELRNDKKQRMKRVVAFLSLALFVALSVADCPRFPFRCGCEPIVPCSVNADCPESFTCCAIECGKLSNETSSCRYDNPQDMSYFNHATCPWRLPGAEPLNSSCVNTGCGFDPKLKLKCCCDGIGGSVCKPACPVYQCRKRPWRPQAGCRFHLDFDDQNCPVCFRLKCDECIDNEESSCRSCACRGGKLQPCTPCGGRETFCRPGFFQEPDPCVSCGCARDGSTFKCWSRCRDTNAFLIESNEDLVVLNNYARWFGFSRKMVSTKIVLQRRANGRSLIVVIYRGVYSQHRNIEPRFHQAVKAFLDSYGIKDSIVEEVPLTN